MTNPWMDPEIAPKQRALADSQLQESPWPRHFLALARAVEGTNCPGAILEVGCGIGQAREILDRAGIEYLSFAGIDLNPASIALAKERYPESQWNVTDGEAMLPNQSRDIVIDGSCVLHAHDWRAHLARLCAVSRRWVVLHRIPICETPTVSEPTSGYGKEFPAWKFNGTDISDEMAKNGFQFMEARTADGPSLTLTLAKPRHYATYSDRNYLTRLKALHASMVRHCGPFVLRVLAWDDAVAEWCATATNVRCLPGEQFLARHPELAIDKLPGPPRTKIEHYWTCGPQWIADVMQETRAPVTYVDADIMFHSSPEPVFAEIGGAPAAVFPHGFAEAKDGLPGPKREISEAFGVFNVGLVYVSERKIAEAWGRKCREWCKDLAEGQKPDGGWTPWFSEAWTQEERENVRGMRYGDQKTLDEWPGEYGARVVTYPGACLGPWAVHTRSLDVRDGVPYFGNRPLVSYHYSGLRELPDGHDVNTRPEYQLTDRQAGILYSPYWAALMEAKK